MRQDYSSDPKPPEGNQPARANLTPSAQFKPARPRPKVIDKTRKKNTTKGSPLLSIYYSPKI